MNSLRDRANPIRVTFPEHLKLSELVQRLLRSRRKGEALRWLLASRQNNRRAIGIFRGAKPSIALVNELYAVGAARVIAADIKSNAAGHQRSEKIVVELPSDQKKRSAIFKWCKAQGSKIGSLPDSDGGESHMYIYIG